MTDLPAPAPASVQFVAVAPASSKPSWKDWIPVFSLLIIVAGILWAGGGRLAQLDDTTRRVVVLEQDSRDRAAQLSKIEDRTARIETKIDLLVDQRLDRPH